MIQSLHPSRHLRFRQRFLQFRELAAGCVQQVRHAYRLSGIGGEKRCAQSDVADVASSRVETRKTIDLESLGGSSVRKDAPPDLGSLRRFRKWKLNHKPDSAQEGLVEGALAVGGQYRQPAIRFH